MVNRSISRREFLQVMGLSLGGFASLPLMGRLPSGSLALSNQFPKGEKLGRVLDGVVEIKARPDDESKTIGTLQEDDVVIWLREVVGRRPLWFNQRYVETPDGFVYCPNLQPVRNEPNQPVLEVPPESGMWVEVSVPYVDLVLANPPARSPWLKYTSKPRLFYSQIMWVDQVKQDEQGQIWYHVVERYGSFGDEFWALGSAFRPIQDEEISPISPDVEDKLVVVNVDYQSLSCFENGVEVYYCRVSTGPKVTSQASNKKEWATPLGRHSIWRKLVSVHMTGGTTGGGYDLPGIGWTTLFSGQGMAIHSTFWHNSYGVPKSHGCVNATPEDAQWVFRWTLPVTPPEPGDITYSGQGSTKVLVQES